MDPSLPSYFLHSKAEASCPLTPPPPSKVSKTCTLTGALVLMARLISLKPKLSQIQDDLRVSRSDYMINIIVFFRYADTG